MGEAIARLTHEVVLFSALGIMSSEKLGNCSERWVYLEFCRRCNKHYNPPWSKKEHTPNYWNLPITAFMVKNDLACFGLNLPLKHQNQKLKVRRSHN